MRITVCKMSKGIEAAEMERRLNSIPEEGESIVGVTAVSADEDNILVFLTVDDEQQRELEIGAQTVKKRNDMAKAAARAAALSPRREQAL